MNLDDFKEWLDDLDEEYVTAEPIKFHLHDFESVNDFTSSMFILGDVMRDSDELVVRYLKPILDDGTVDVQFQLLRSKAKVFFRYLNNSRREIHCILKSNKEFKEAVKFFNSLGVKGEDMVSLKELDYASMFKEGLDETRKFDEFLGRKLSDAVEVTISIAFNENGDVYYPILFYDFVSESTVMPFSDAKSWIKKEILGIHDN